MMMKAKVFFLNYWNRIRTINTKKNWFVFLLVITLFFLTFVTGLFTFESKSYFFANSLFDYRRGNTSSNSPSLHIHKEGEYSYQTLYSHYYYSTEVKSFRTICDDSTSVSNSGFSYDCLLTKIQTYSIGDKYSWGYYVDGGLFSSYYKNELFEGRGYLDIRYNCSGFAYISDSLADKMISSLNISSYEELITNKEYAVINVLKDGESTPISLSINNILYSKYRTGPRITEIYGDFILIYLSGSTQNKSFFNWSVELDLKTDTYENKKLVGSLNELGYNVENSDFFFYVFNKQSKTKISLDNPNHLIYRVRKNDIYDGVHLVLSICITASLLIGLALVDIKFGEEFELLFSLNLFFSLLYFLIIFFVFVPPLLNILSVIMFITSMVHYGRKIPFIRMRETKQANIGSKRYVIDI